MPVTVQPAEDIKQTATGANVANSNTPCVNFVGAGAYVA